MTEMTIEAVDLLKEIKVDSEWQGGSTPLCSDCNARMDRGTFEFHQAKQSGRIAFNLYCTNCSTAKELGEENGYFKNHETGGYNYHSNIGRGR
jgi:hypothetical protein